MTIEQPVWAWLPERTAPIEAARFGWDERLQEGRLRYLDSYRQLPEAFAIDPVQLPLTAQEQRTRKQRGLFGVLHDAGPDYYGLFILERQLGHRPTPIERLTVPPLQGSGAVGLGELTPARLAPAPSLQTFTTQLELALREQGEAAALNEVIAGLAFSPTAGGAKPKLAVMDGEHPSLLKYPDRGDPPDLAAAEAAMLTLAGHCGIETTAHRVVTTGSGHDARQGLLVRRFDRQGERRLPYASAHSVMNLDTGLEPNRSYIHFAHELGRWCQRGADRQHGRAQKRELWRRIVFNGLIANLDDHSRNHALIREEGVWRLAPAFDLVPIAIGDGPRALSMPFLPGEQGNRVTRDHLLAASRHFGWAADEAVAELARMAGIVASGWETAMRQHGVAATRLHHYVSTFAFATELNQGTAA